MKKINIIFIIFMVIFPTTVKAENLNLSGESYVIIEENSGRILYEKNGYRKMPMASTTKIMTALVALEYGDPTKLVNIDSESVGVEGSSIYLKEGESMTLEDLLYGLMLRSGNDAAVAISKHVGSNSENFVNLMNTKAKEIGTINTHFTNPNGLHNEDHYSTAYDLAIITREAFKHDLFEKIVGSKSYKSTRDENNLYYNKNKTIFEYDGGDGVKTGYTTNSGRCLVSSAHRNNMRLIAVVLNGYDWFNDNYKLLDYGFENFKPFIIYDKMQYMKSIKLENGKKDKLNLVTEKEFIYPLSEDESKDVSYNIQLPDKLEAPILKGEKIGQISTYLYGKLINKENLIARETIERKGMIERLLNKFEHNKQQ